MRQSKATLDKLQELNKNFQWPPYMDGGQDVERWRACVICKEIYYGIGLSTATWTGGKPRYAPHICSKGCAKIFMNVWLKKHLTNYPDIYKKCCKTIEKISTYPVDK